MEENWAVVGTAIKQRRAEIGMTQVALGRKANVSKQIVGEIENNKVERRRGGRTLEALSTALGWHPHHLAAVLIGQLPPSLNEPVPTSDEDIPGHISVMEYQMRELLREVHSVHGELAVLKSMLDAAGFREDTGEQPADS